MVLHLFLSVVEFVRAFNFALRVILLLWISWIQILLFCARENWGLKKVWIFVCWKDELLMWLKVLAFMD